MRLPNRLRERARLRIIMLGFLLAVPADIQTDSQRYGHGIGILESHGAFESDHVVGQRNMIIRTLHSLLHHPQRFVVLAAEPHLGRVHEYQFIGGTRAADRTDVTHDTALGQFAHPIARIGEQRPVVRSTKSLRNGQHRDFRIESRKNFLQKPVDAERGNAADHEIRTLDDLLPLLEIMETYIFGERTAELFVFSGFQITVDDFVVETSADDVHFMAVFSRRKCQSRSHHTGSDDCDFAFFHNTCFRFAKACTCPLMMQK